MSQNPPDDDEFYMILLTYTAIVSGITLLISKCCCKCSRKQRPKKGPKRPDAHQDKGERSSHDDSSSEQSSSAKDPCKLVLMVRTDVGMKTGKMCAQCGHASVDALTEGLRNYPSRIRAWRKGGQMKIVVKVNGEQLEAALSVAQALGLPHGLIQDAGRTQVEPGTVTVGYIGPCLESEVDEITGGFSLL